MLRSFTRLGAQRSNTPEVTSQEDHSGSPSSGPLPPRESAFSSLDEINSVLSSSSVASLLQKFSFPEGYEAFDRSPTDRVHHPPPGYLTVYAAQLSLGLRFPPSLPLGPSFKYARCFPKLNSP